MTFFDITPRGRIENRISKDIDVIDNTIPNQYTAFFMSASVCVGSIITTCALNWLSIFVAIPMLLFFVIAYGNFRKLSPQFRRLEGATRGPVLQTCDEMLEYQSAIKVFGQEAHFRSIIRFKANDNLQAFWLGLALERWICFRLGLAAAAFSATSILTSMLITPTNGSIAQYTGIIMTQGFSII